MSGSLRTVIEALRDQLAAAPAFIERCALSDYEPDDPLKHIYLNEVLIETARAYDTEMDDKRPFLILMVNPHGYSQVSQGVGVGMVASGTIDVIFCDNAREKDDPDDNDATYLDFIDWTTEITDWVADNNGTGDYLVPWSSIQQTEPPARTELQKRTDAHDVWATTYQFQYGAVQE